ncbi:MAG: glutathione S-transferase domain-containing protein [Calditrichota bacterium]
MLDSYAEGVWGKLTSRALKKKDKQGNSLDEAGKKSLQAKIDEEAGLLDDYFRYHRFAAGDSPSLGDLSLSAFLSRIQEISDFWIDSRYEYLLEWCSRIDKRLHHDMEQPSEV